MEYKVVMRNFTVAEIREGEMDEWLNVIGKEGWKLVDTNSSGNWWTVFFTRDKT
jgi:hypothetical protein